MSHLKNNTGKFEPVGKIICDGIIFPKLPIICGKKEPWVELKKIFVRAGVPVSSVCESNKKG